MKNYSKLLLTTEDSKLQTWDNEKTVFHFQCELGGAMGLVIDKGLVFVNTPNFINSLDENTYKVINSVKSQQNAQYHHMNMYDNLLYVTATMLNEIHVYDTNLLLKKRIKITPPQPNKPIIYKGNYNHLNAVIRHDQKFYVSLNWLNKQYGMSGVAVLNENWEELNRFEMGWEAHDLQFYDGKLITICGTSNPDKEINHPKKSGIMIGNELVFEHDYRESFCKALTWDDNYFYMCGGVKAVREERKKTNAIVYVINRKSFGLVEKLDNLNISNIKGCRIYEN